jgi:hypothetical protein
VRELLEDLLRPLVVQIGLDYRVAPAARGLPSPTGRRPRWCVSAAWAWPLFIVLDQRRGARSGVAAKVLEGTPPAQKGQGVVWRCSGPSSRRALPPGAGGITTGGSAEQGWASRP